VQERDSEDRKMSGAIEHTQNLCRMYVCLKQPQQNSASLLKPGLDGEHKYDKRFRLCQTEEHDCSIDSICVKCYQTMRPPKREQAGS